MTAAVASGRFTVRMQPLDPAGPAAGDAVGTRADTTLGRLALDKRYDGDLAATGQGTMLTAMSSTPGSAAYVAIERVTGSLHGREGSFVLQHAGTMDRGAPTLAVSVVPDSGSGELAGLGGRLAITVSDGVHHYRLDYSLPG